MTDFARLHELQKLDAAEVFKGFGSQEESAVALGMQIVRDAQRYGLNLKDYLRAAIKPVEGLDGYETALAHLKLPVKEDFGNNVSLQLASDTFFTNPASRILFPEVVLDMVDWKTKQDQIVNIEGLISQTRTVSGTNQIIWEELDDSASNLHMAPVPEGSPVPITKIASSSRSVSFYKVGRGYQFTYEFARRISIDVLTPFVNRLNRQFEIDQVRHATAILINGDGVAGAITAKAETDYGGTNGTLDYQSLMRWLAARAAAGYPVDTLVGNYDSLIEILFMFAPDGKGVQNTAEEVAKKVGMGFNVRVALSFLNQTINFAISPTVAAKTLIGITKGETLEKLVEAGSDISELERSITNQVVTFVRTLNVGFNLAIPLARQSFSWAS